jgi:hypothetical protein
MTAMSKSFALAFLLSASALHAQLPNYTGQTKWDANSGTVTFVSSGSMPTGKEEFLWQVPQSVKRIVIDAKVTVRGGFRVAFRSPENPLHIEGRDQETSVIFGTEDEAWTTKNQVPDNARWKYGAVSVLADAMVQVSNLTSLNPRCYHISGYANRSVIDVSHCKLLDRRSGHNNNSDGFIGAAGSSITDSFISTGDDAIKVYHDMTIRNVVIEHHRNGAPIQFGWGGENGHAKAVIEKLTIKGVSPDGLYNMAPFTWESGNGGIRDVTISTLQVTATGKLFDEESHTWVPMGLFELKPKSCTLNLSASGVEIGQLSTGIRRTAGVITLNGRSVK